MIKETETNPSILPYCYEYELFDYEDADNMAKDFCWEYRLNEGIDLYLDIGDMDYANAEQCKVLKPRIEERLKKPITPWLKEMYTMLFGLCFPHDRIQYRRLD